MQTSGLIVLINPGQGKTFSLRWEGCGQVFCKERGNRGVKSLSIFETFVVGCGGRKFETTAIRVG
jgi:hypothetical protein